MDLFSRLQHIDRRILYVLAAVVLSVPILIRPSEHPSTVFPEVQRAYNTINSVPPGKIVILSTWWGPGTQAENEPQTEVLMRNMFAKGIKFVVMSWDPAGTQLTYQLGMKLQHEMHKKYGVDWAHLGYIVGSPIAIISGISENFQFLGHDIHNTRFKDLPIVRNIKSYKQIGAVVDITPSGTGPYWISYMTTPKHIPLIYCPTAVMSAEAYPYLDSGQYAGMLNGVMGAVQYETLIGRAHKRTQAAAMSWALSAAHVYILLLIVLGNIGYFVSRRRSGRGGSRVG